MKISFFCKLKEILIQFFLEFMHALFEFLSFANISYTFALLKQFVSASHFNLLSKI